MRDGTEVAVHENDGIRKICGCRRPNWPKCRHPWHFSHKYGGVHYRFSLDRHLGRHLDSKTEAEDAAERLRVAIKDGTFNSGANDHSPEAPEGESTPPLETFENYAGEWLRTTAALNLKSSTIRFYRDNLKNYIFPAFGVRPVGEIRREDCRRLIATAREKGLRCEQSPA
jgi:hypothetical protein